MEISIKGNFEKENSMDRVSIYGSMDLSMKEVSRMVFSVATVLGCQNKMILMKVSTKIIRKMEKVLILGIME